MDAGEARALFASVPVARLATVDAGGGPHLVPITFALGDGDVVVTAVDHKPKRTSRLRRLANIEANPRVAVLADSYEDDWSRLWWVRGDGLARVIEPGDQEHARAVERLAARYPQYAERVPEGPAIEIRISRWSGWRSAR
jgi:PPOX class probable F420-dependent enzyme